MSDIVFSSDFESGSGTNFHVRDDGAIGFSIPKQPGKEYLWFYFKVENAGEKPLEFVVENAAGAHQTGRRWSITKPVFSIDGKKWVKSKEAKYYPWLKHLKVFGQPVFRFKAPFVAHSYWVAYSYPYTNRDLDSFLDKIRTLPKVSISTIGKSEEKRDIYKIHIGEGREEGKKKQIWLVCREHPGETPSSLVCEGFIDALLFQPVGKRLREQYEFNIIPILNVDGVARGYYYRNVKGVDLALDWEKFSAVETRLFRDAIKAEVEKKRVKLVMNFHSANDPSKGHFFLKMPEHELTSYDKKLQKRFFETGGKSHSQLQGHSPVKLWDIDGITGKALYKQYGVYCLYLESNYSRGADGSIVTEESLRSLGASMAETLLKVLD